MAWEETITEYFEWWFIFLLEIAFAVVPPLLGAILITGLIMLFIHLIQSSR